MLKVNIQTFAIKINDGKYFHVYFWFLQITVGCAVGGPFSAFLLYFQIHFLVPKCMSCHKAIVVITGRAHCFHDCTYIYISRGEARQIKPKQQANDRIVFATTYNPMLPNMRSLIKKHLSVLHSHSNLETYFRKILSKWYIKEKISKKCYLSYCIL